MENTESKIDKIISNKAVFLVAIISTAFGFYNYINSPTTELQKNLVSMREDQIKTQDEITFIKENHLKHIEADISEIRQEQGLEKEKNNQRDITQERLLTLLEEHVRATQKGLTTLQNIESNH
ncbi:MAG: hypothetical protein WCI36_03095 [bacterium]